MKTAEFIADKQEQILNAYGLNVTSTRHIDCFICSGVKKLRINWYNGDIRGICTCGSYSLLDLLCELTGKDFKHLAAEIDKDYGNTHDQAEPKKDSSKRDQAVRLFQTSKPLRGTDGEVYLQGRGIFETPTGGVKFGAVHDHKENRRIPAMIAIASTEFAEPRQLHVTYIENGKKADIETQRKMHSLAPLMLSDKETSEPIAIKLFQATNVLGIAEGIESALSAKQLYKVPTWSAMNATYLKKFRAPTGVETLYVFSDADKTATGIAAAMECARGNLLSSNDVTRVVVRWPDKQGFDFNDIIQQGGEVLEQVFDR